MTSKTRKFFKNLSQSAEYQALVAAVEQNNQPEIDSIVSGLEQKIKAYAIKEISAIKEGDCRVELGQALDKQARKYLPEWQKRAIPYNHMFKPSDFL